MNTRFHIVLLAGLVAISLAGCDAFRQSARTLPTPTPPGGAATGTGQEHQELRAGDQLFDQQDFAGAVEAYSRAVEQNPQSAQALNDRGLAYYRLEDYAHALADLNQALALRPDYVNALTNRAFVYFDLGKMENCIADATRALELDPGDDSAYMIRSNADLRLGNVAGWIADWMQAAQIRRARASQ